MRFSELKPGDNIVDYIIHTLFIDSIVDDEEAEALTVEIAAIRGADACDIEIHDKENPYGIHSKFTVTFGEHLAIADIRDEDTQGDGLYAVFKYQDGPGCHVEYILK